MFINLSEVSPLSHTHIYVCELYIKRIILKKRLPNINGHIKCMWYQTDYFVTLVRTTFNHYCCFQAGKHTKSVGLV